MEKSTKILIAAWICSIPFSWVIGAIFPVKDVQGFYDMLFKFIVVVWVSVTYVFVTLDLVRKAEAAK